MTKYINSIINFISKKEVYGIVVTLAVAYFVYRTITIVLEEEINKGKNPYEKKKRKTITKLFKNVIKYLMLIISFLAILSIYGVNIKGMVAGLGITATLLGLALQDTFKDIINGINIILENYYIVGDTVKYGEFTGEVIEFGLKSTKIKNFQGEVLIVANRNIMEIKNISQKEQQVTLNVPLPYEEPVEKVEKIINEEILEQIKKIENVIEGTVQYLGINELADSCIKYLIMFKCKRETQWQATRNANKIILTTLAKHKISVPYPQLEVHNHGK